MTRDLICGPKVTRRSFSTWLLLFAVGIAAFTMSGCNVLQDLIDYIPWIVRALQSISSIVGPFMPAPAATILGIITGALTDLQAACVQYQGDPLPADKANLLAEIKTFLKDIANNFQLFLNALATAGPVLGVVLGIIQVVLSTLGWFSGSLPVSATATAMQMPMTLRASNQILYIIPQKRSLKQFKQDFNTVVQNNGHPEQTMY